MLMSVRWSVRRSARPSVGRPNGFRPITGERLAVGSSNITCGHPRGLGGNLSISGPKGQGHRPSEHAERFPTDNWRTLCQRIIKLYLETPQGTGKKPIDFRCRRSKVKVTGPPNVLNGFRPITGELLAVGSSNFTCAHPRGQGGNLSISGAECQRSRSQAL